MQYLILAFDGKDVEAPKRRSQVRDAHIQLSNKMLDRGEALYGVALLNEAGSMIGSVYIVDFPSREKLDEWLKQEPYVVGKVWQQIEIHPCRVGPSFLKPR